MILWGEAGLRLRLLLAEARSVQIGMAGFGTLTVPEDLADEVGTALKAALAVEVPADPFWVVRDRRRRRHARAARAKLLGARPCRPAVSAQAWAVRAR